MATLLLFQTGDNDDTRRNPWLFHLATRGSWQLLLKARTRRASLLTEYQPSCVSASALATVNERQYTEATANVNAVSRSWATC
jgi:hypothetical protein